MYGIRRIFAVVAVWGALFLSACGGDAGSTDAGTAPTTAPQFPMTFENCGHSITLKKEPSRIVTVNDTPVRNVSAAGGLDKVVATAGIPADPVFDEATAAHVKRVPVLAGPSGTLSTEVILNNKPDLVIGTQDNLGITYEDLQTVNIPLFISAGSCTTKMGGINFTDIQNDILLFGRIFGTENQAKQSVASIQSRLAEVKNKLKPAATEHTAAALFISGEKLSAYGSRSMSHTQFGLLGLRNIFSDVDKRIFETSVEEIINRNPDYIEVLTYPEPGKPAPTLEDLKAFPGMTNVTAIKNDHVIFLAFAYSGNSAVSVEGIQRLADGFDLLK